MDFLGDHFGVESEFISLSSLAAFKAWAGTGARWASQYPNCVIN